MQQAAEQLCSELRANEFNQLAVSITLLFYLSMGTCTLVARLEFKVQINQSHILKDTPCVFFLPSGLQDPF